MNQKQKLPPYGMTEKEWMEMLIKSREFQQWQRSGPDVIGSQAHREWYRKKHGVEWPGIGKARPRKSLTEENQ